MEFATFGALAIALGVKHAFDADHLLAVSNLLTRRERLSQAFGLSASWAAGHLVTAGLVSAALFAFSDTLLQPLLAHMELVIPVMLILVAAVALGVEYRRFHVHRHAHAPGGPEHRHFHAHWRPHHAHGAMAGIGVVHGLASNDELLVVLLVGLAADAWWELGLGVALFSLGVLVGMLAYAAVVHAGSHRVGWARLPSILNVTFAVAGIAYAAYLLSGGGALNLLDAWVP